MALCSRCVGLEFIYLVRWLVTFMTFLNCGFKVLYFGGVTIDDFDLDDRFWALHENLEEHSLTPCGQLLRLLLAGRCSP